MFKNERITFILPINQARKPGCEISLELPALETDIPKGRGSGSMNFMQHIEWGGGGIFWSPDITGLFFLIGVLPLFV